MEPERLPVPAAAQSEAISACRGLRGRASRSGWSGRPARNGTTTKG